MGVDSFGTKILGVIYLLQSSIPRSSILIRLIR